jgi:hypothetical protein
MGIIRATSEDQENGFQETGEENLPTSNVPLARKDAFGESARFRTPLNRFMARIIR